MKGQIPIVIAMAIVLAVMFSILYFITTTSMETLTTDIPYSIIYWLRIQEELDNLAHIALKHGSREADKVFAQVYSRMVQNAGDLSDLEHAVTIANSQADQVMKKKVYEIIGNWTLLKEREGLTIEFKKLSATYHVGYGRGYSNVFFRVKIISCTGEYREFMENYTIFYELNLRKIDDELLSNTSSLLDELEQLGLDYAPGVNLTLVFDATAYIDMNGKKYYFMLNNNSARETARNLINMLSTLYNLSTVNYTLAGTYYYGQGHTKIVYHIDPTTAIISSLQELFARNKAGITSSINIDGFIARTAITLT